MSKRVSTRSFPFPSASMWMQRSGQIRSHWKQMMHRSLPVSGSMGRASRPWNRWLTGSFSTGYFTVTLRRTSVSKVTARPPTSAPAARTTRSAGAWRSLLPVDVREDDVDAPEDGDDVGHLPPLHHLGERVQVAEGRPADLDPVRGLAAVAHEEDPQVAPGRLGPDVDLAPRRLHRHRDPGPDLAPGQVPEGLPDDADRLAHLLHPDQVPRVAVALGPDRHVELDPVVRLVGGGLPHVHRHPAGAGHGARRPHGDGVPPADDPHPPRPGLEDRVGGEELVVLVDPGEEVVQELETLLRPPRGQVAQDPAHAVVD